MSDKDQIKELKVEFTREVAAGHYCNLAAISHNATEFFIDFISNVPNMPYANVLSRIILAPENAKELLETLYENVQRYESTYGPIVHKMALNLSVQDIPLSTPMSNSYKFQTNESKA